MKINKLMPLLAGAVALSVSAVPLIVKADAIHKGFPLVAQGTQTPHKKAGHFPSLNLSDTQKQQLRQIEQDTQKQVEQVYRPDQLAKVQAANLKLQQGQRVHFRDVINSLNLDANQKARLKQIQEAQKVKVLQVFTPEQRRQYEQYVRE